MVTNPGISTGTTGAFFSQPFTQSGAVGGTTFSLDSGTLPMGLMLSTAGVLSGTPTEVGTFPITVKVTSDAGCTGVGSTYTLQITCPMIAVSGTIPALTFDAAMATATFSQAGGTGTITWSATGLPTVTSIDSGTGQVTGTPNVTGTFSVMITATDADGCTGAKGLSVTVAPVATADSYSGLVDNTQFVVTGGTTASPATPSVGTDGDVSFRLTNNDLPSGGVTLTTGTFATATGGSVTIAADGTFIYTPKANPTLAATTSDSFTYMIASDTGGTGTPVTADGTATLTLVGRVWYVLNNGAAGNGQSQSSFNLLSSAIAASTANDTIFVYQGSGTTTNLATASILKTGQKFIGEGAALVVNGNTLVAAGGFPLIGNSLVLANNVTINGIDMSTGPSRGITNFNVAYNTVTGVSVTARNVTSTTGTAIDVQGSGNTGAMTFRSVSANGGANGIALQNFTGGGFTITGDGTNAANGSGGTIQNMTGANGAVAGRGINLTTVQNVSLRQMNLHDFTNFAIYGSNVTGFWLDYATISGVNGNSNAGGSEEGSIRFDNLFTSVAFPTAQVTNSTISGGGTFNLFVLNTTAGSTLNRLMLTNDTFGLISATIGNDNVDVYAQPSPATNNPLVNVTLQDCTFLGTKGDFFEAIGDGNSTMDVVARRNTFISGQAIVPGGGVGISIRGDQVGSADTMTFDVSCNNIVGAVAPNQANAYDTVAMFVAKGNGAGSWSGSIVNNTIGPAKTSPSEANADGIFVRATGTNTINVLIQDNTLSGYGNAGLHLQNNDGSVTMNASIFGNVLSAPNSQNFAGLFVDNGGTATDTTTANIVVGSATDATKQNTLAGSGLGIDVSLSNFNASTTFKLSKNGSASVTATGVIQDDNVGSPTVDTSGGVGPITLVVPLPTVPATPTTCTVPP